MPHLLTGSASVDIARPADEVFAAITDLERMGEWSPEAGAVRWLDGASAAGLGVRFAGDNEVALGPIPLKRWTTESEITVFDPPSAFGFVAAGYTTWHFDLDEHDAVTTLTESFAFPPYTGLKRVTYGLLGARERLMLTGVERTLAAIKQHVEAT